MTAQAAIQAMTVDDLVSASEAARDADTLVADIGADLLAGGCTLAELGRALGVARQSATERVQATPLPREVVRAWYRVTAWRAEDEPQGVRVSTVGRLVVFDMGRAMQEHTGQPSPTCWRVLRHTPQEADAEQLAAYLGRDGDGAFRYVRRPRDLDAANVLPWRLP